MQKTLSTTFLTLLVVSILYPTSFAQDHITQWALPEGAKARFGKGIISDIAYSPDGSLLAVASSIGVWIYDAQTGKELDLLTGQKAWRWSMSVVFSPDGQILASHGNLDNNIYLWDATTRTRLHTLTHVKTHNDIKDIVFSPDGQILASHGSLDNTINLWNPKTGTLIRSINHNTSYSGSGSLAFSTDGQILISQSLKDIILWETATATPIRTLTVPDTELWSMALSPDGKILASMTKQGIYLWEINTGAIKHTIEVPFSYGQTIFSPNGEFLLHLSRKGALYIYNVKTGGDVTGLLVGSYGSVLSLMTAGAFAPDGQTFAVSSSTGHIELRGANTFRLLKQQHIYGHGNILNDVALSPDGKIIAGACTDLLVRLWDTNTGEFTSIPGHNGTVTSVIFINLKNPILVSASMAGDIVFRDYKTLLMPGRSSVLRVIETGHMHRGSISRIAISPDGKTLATGSYDTTVSLWDAETGEHQHTLVAEGGRRVRNVVFSPDGQTLASSSDAVYLWDVGTGERLQTLKRKDYFFGGHGLAFSPDGKIIVSTFENDSGAFSRPPWDSPWDGVHLWDVTTGVLLRSFPMGGSECLIFNPDGRIMVTGNAWGEVFLWDITTGTELHKVTGHKGGSVTGLAFSPDGHTLASSGTDGTVLLWDVNTALPEPEYLPEDVNTDGVVNVLDLILIAGKFGETSESECDVNGDGIVNIEDLLRVAGALDTGAAAPSIWSRDVENAPTRAAVQQWLHEARQINLTDSAFQRGILVLEQLLAALTPKETVLLPNYPNPFNPETWIPYQLAAPSEVVLTIYAANGAVVRTLTLGHQPADLYQSRSRAAYWDGRNDFGELVASGVYFYTLTAEDYTATRKMLIRK